MYQKEKVEAERQQRETEEVEKEEEVDEGDGSRGGADAAQRAARNLAPLFAQAFFPPFRPSFPPLPRERQPEEEPPRASATDTPDTRLPTLSAASTDSALSTDTFENLTPP